ncbi:dihydrodipicolinate synthase family protein [Sphingobium quisquiliarum]|nr:dihydrodipicolinate synthase family protein [Sphingobium quisquiliarum]
MVKTTQLSSKDIKGVIAYMPTPVRTDIVIDRHAKDVLNLDEAARAADVLIKDGATGICLNGTFGELPSLTFEEIVDLTRAVVESVNDRVPVFAGATTLNTRDTIKRVRAFREVGAHGLNMGRPMMSAMSDIAIVQYYRDIAEEFPDMAIFLYDDMQAFKRPITTEVYAELAKIPQIVACKYRTMLVLGQPIANNYANDMRAVDGRIKLLTHEYDWWISNKLFDMDAIWSSSISMAPGPIMAMQDAILAKDYAKAEVIRADMQWASEGLFPKTGIDDWHVSKIPAMKTRIHTSGYIKCGPALPPYHVAPEERFEAGRAAGMRDREMHKKYPHKTMRQAESAVREVSTAA